MPPVLFLPRPISNGCQAGTRRTRESAGAYHRRRTLLPRTVTAVPVHVGQLTNSPRKILLEWHFVSDFSAGRATSTARAMLRTESAGRCRAACGLHSRSRVDIGGLPRLMQAVSRIDRNLACRRAGTRPRILRAFAVPHRHEPHLEACPPERKRGSSQTPSSVPLAQRATQYRHISEPPARRSVPCACRAVSPRKT